MSALKADVKKAHQKVSQSPFFHKDELWLCVLSVHQKIALMDNDKILVSYPISTAKNGLGCAENSYKTPTGLHQVIQKIGEGSAINQIFQARKPIERIAIIQKESISSGQDLITSRILRLSGLESGINYGNHVDSFDRYIYIHGTNEEGLIGKSVSHGCIRMKNKNIISHYEQITPRTLVYIN